MLHRRFAGFAKRLGSFGDGPAECLTRTIRCLIRGILHAKQGSDQLRSGAFGQARRRAACGIQCILQSIDLRAICQQPAFGAFKPFGQATALTAEQLLGFLGTSQYGIGDCFQRFDLGRGGGKQTARFRNPCIQARQGEGIGFIDFAHA